MFTTHAITLPHDLPLRLREHAQAAVARSEQASRDTDNLLGQWRQRPELTATDSAEMAEERRAGLRCRVGVTRDLVRAGVQCVSLRRLLASAVPGSGVGMTACCLRKSMRHKAMGLLWLGLAVAVHTVFRKMLAQCMIEPPWRLAAQHHVS
jgi:hypothetical protein